MTKTNMAVLDQACRNAICPDWFIVVRRLSWASREGSIVATANYRWRYIVAEYARLMRLKARKKGWRGNVSNYTKHQQAVNNDTVRG